MSVRKTNAPQKNPLEINNLAEFYRLKVRDIVDKRWWDLPTVAKDGDILHVLSLLRTQFHVWIVNDMKRRDLCGVITEHDLLNLLAPRTHPGPAHLFGLGDIQRWTTRNMVNSISGIMCRGVISAGMGDTIRSILLKMKKHSIRRIPIVDGGKLVGEVTLHTLLNKYFDIVSKGKGNQRQR